MPDSLTYIGNLAFCDCCSLVDLTIPANVTKIADHAFYGCQGLESILVSSNNAVYHSQGNCCIETNTNCLVFGCKNSNIPDETIVIGQGAFGGCTGLKNIEIPSSVIEIRSEAFCGCKRLEKVAFSEGVGKICTKAFMDCSALKELFLPAGVSEIETFAFPGCTSLRSIKVSSKNSVYHSEDDCCIRSRDGVLILGCRNSIIPDGITEIGENAFYNCYGLTDIYLPESVIKIGESAFSGSGLTSITIPRCVEFIGSFAFYQCNDLLSITIPSSVRYIGELALSGYESTSKNRKVFCETNRKPGRWHREWTDENSVVYWSGDWYYNKEGIPIEDSGDRICQELKLPIAPAESIEQERLLADLVKACGQLQAEKHYWGTKENPRNSYIRNALDNMGYVLRDQTLLGISSGETDEGELDLDIRKHKDVPWTICEALRVDSGSKADWNSHLKKLLDNYNPNGVRFLVLLTYVDVEKDKFDQIWNSFKNHIQGYDEGKFALKLDSFKHYQTETWTGNHYIQTAKCKYILGEYTPTVYHVFVRMGR